MELSDLSEGTYKNKIKGEQKSKLYKRLKKDNMHMSKIDSQNKIILSFQNYAIFPKLFK